MRYKAGRYVFVDTNDSFTNFLIGDHFWIGVVDT